MSKSEHAGTLWLWLQEVPDTSEDTRVCATLTQHHHEILPSSVSPSAAAADSAVHHQRRETRFSQPEAEISQTPLSKEALSTSSLQSTIPLRFYNSRGTSTHLS
ncbi:hypothetical protein F2P79_008267 [Pimephales promelas]|nr:hypothetical protein F2P79_008267 [Pimephales promelas]